MDCPIKISEIQIIPVKPHEGLIGFASLVLDDRYYLGSVAIFTRAAGRGYRLVYPTRKVGDRNIDLFHPINAETGRAIEEAVSEKVSKIFSDDFYGHAEF